MSGPISLDKIQAAREEFERMLGQMIAKFEEATGCQVESFDILRIYGRVSSVSISAKPNPSVFGTLTESRGGKITLITVDPTDGSTTEEDQEAE